MSKKILIIDDETGFCDVVKDALTDQGYRVDTPRHLASAIGSALQGAYDLIILDLRMPGLDGLEIARLFKKRQLSTPCSSSPVISPKPSPVSSGRWGFTTSCPNPPACRSFAMRSPAPSPAEPDRH